MDPFDVEEALGALIAHYPPVDDLVALARSEDRRVHHCLIRLWLSEGIPFAFREKPALYDAFRHWLARRLDLDAKELTVIGSARLGFALAHGEKLGRDFGPHSDLDMTAVSRSLFDSVGSAFAQWRDDYLAGRVHPNNDREGSYWKENLDVCARSNARGFFDPRKLPARDRYPIVQKVNNALWMCHEKLKLSPGAPIVRRVSLRVYADWAAFLKQASINLAAIAQRAAMK